MRKLKEFNDFLFDSLLEKINEGELPFILSKRLKTLLEKINHTISRKLLNDYSNQESAKVTLVDYDDTKDDYFTFATSTKIIDYITSKTLTDNQEKNIGYLNGYSDFQDNPLWLENRSSIKAGKFVNKVYPNVYVNAGKPGEDISSFVEMIKVERAKGKGTGNFRIVEGQDVVKYYLEDNYEDSGYGSTLYGSCMKYPNCQPYIGFYSKNNVKLVVLMSEKETDKIVGRALLWDIDEIDDVKVNRKFMDRIYTIKNTQTEKFKQFAEDNKWLYKSNQDMFAETNIIDPEDGTSRFRSLKVNNVKEYKAYPYMDTLKCFNTKDHFLTNNDDAKYHYYLESTDGGYDKGGDGYVYSSYHDTVLSEYDMVWSDDLERYISKDEAVYSEFVDEWVSKEYADEYWVYSELENDYIPRDEAVHINDEDGWVSDSYADDNYMECYKDEKFYKIDDCVPSEQWVCVPHEHVIYVITDDEVDLDDIPENMTDMDLGGEMDARWKGDGTYFTVHDNKRNKDWNFDNSLKGCSLVRRMKKGVK